MIYQIGNVQFTVMGLNMLDVQRSTEARHVEKPVLGRRPPLEFIGDGNDTVKISAKVFPHALGPSGLSAIEALEGMRADGGAIPVMRGDGKALGHYVVKGFSEKHGYIDRAGLGKVIDVDIDLLKSSSSGSNGGFLAGLFSLF